MKLIIVMGLLMLVGCASTPDRTTPREEWPWKKANFTIPDKSNMPNVDEDVAVAIQNQGYYMSTNYTIKVKVIKYH